MIGYFANFASTRMKRPKVAIPMMIRQRTVAESHGKVTPPYSRPKRNKRVPPTTKKAPNQSMALSPSMKGVLGVLRSRKTMIIANARPSNGTMSYMLAREVLRMASSSSWRVLTIDVESPSPRYLFCQGLHSRQPDVPSCGYAREGSYSANDGTQSTRNSPYTTNHAIVCASSSWTE